MESKRIRILIHILRQQTIVPDATLQALLREASTSRALLARLVADQTVTQDWATATERLLRRKARRVSEEELAERKGDRTIGQLALLRGWLDVSALEDAILEQQRLRRMNLRFRLGEILMQRGVLSADQVRALLAEQGYATAVCRRCEEIVAVSEPVAAEGKQHCPACKASLRPTQFLDIVHADR